MTSAPDSIADPTPEFIARWQASAAAERANYQLFLSELCGLLGVPPPEPTTSDPERNAYVFERDVTFEEGDGTTSTGRIDLYKRGCFVLEAKQGSDAQRATDEDLLSSRATAGPASSARRKRGTAVRGTPAWDDAMIAARGQADRYARALPTAEGWPPFLLVVDVGHVIELYSEFTRQGKTYVPFPDPQSFRIKLADLADEKIRQRLAAVWTDPLALDPSRKSAKVTRELAGRLAELAKLLERAGHDPARVARFLMRCLFTMFAEDVELIARDSFKNLLKDLHANPAAFQPMVESLWQTMNSGGFSTVLRQKVLRFNGGLFAEHEALPLTTAMLKLLADAAAADWKDVEPAIFGTLLERALDPVERHKLGAHYTPRAYVERLVMPTIIEPLRDEWRTVYATALAEARQGDLSAAHDLVRKFHERLCEIRVLDPACGSGNFLYVTLEHMKRLEGEVLNTLQELGYRQKILLEVDPEKFLGIELNPRAAAIADLVLWIGYLQWHFRTRGKAQPAEPIIKDYDNIECRDAVLTWDSTEPLLGDDGQPVTRWDGRTTKLHPVTQEQVPDETARVPVLRYINPRKAEWPKADFILGNPPYIGVRRLKTALGDDYVNALRQIYTEVPETCDLVLYWWHKGAELISSRTAKQFGFITTNSITQDYSRPLIERHVNDGGSAAIIFAVSDHPWVEAEDGAAVRVAMTVVANREDRNPSRLGVIVAEDGEDVTLRLDSVNKITSSLDANVELGLAAPLHANDGMCFQGVVPAGDGFKLDVDDLAQLGISAKRLPSVVRRYIIGKDLVQHAVDRFIIDCFGLSDKETREQFPALYQRLFDRVLPDRRQNKRPAYRDKWWIFAEPRPALRAALNGLKRYIATPYTAKHRPFVFVSGDVLPDAMAYAIATENAFLLGVLSSRPHVVWSRTVGGTLEDRPRYNSKVTFSPFPFPEQSDANANRVSLLAEQLDAHRKRQQALHSWLTLTDMYNVLEKLRAGEPLTDKDRRIHDAGLVSVLKQIHDELDAAVFAAYGWPATLTDEQILERLVALNAERAAEEARGLVRWLRPEFQVGSAGSAEPIGRKDDEAEGIHRKGPRPGKPRTAGQASSGTPAGRQEPRPPADSTAGQASKPHTAGQASSGTPKQPKRPWPKERAARTKAVQDALAAAAEPLAPGELARQFARAQSAQVEEILEALVSLGLAHRRRGGKFAQ